MYTGTNISALCVGFFTPYLRFSHFEPHESDSTVYKSKMWYHSLHISIWVYILSFCISPSTSPREAQPAVQSVRFHTADEFSCQDLVKAGQSFSISRFCTGSVQETQQLQLKWLDMNLEIVLSGRLVMSLLEINVSGLTFAKLWRLVFCSFFFFYKGELESVLSHHLLWTDSFALAPGVLSQTDHDWEHLRVWKIFWWITNQRPCLRVSTVTFFNKKPRGDKEHSWCYPAVDVMIYGESTLLCK